MCDTASTSVLILQAAGCELDAGGRGMHEFALGVYGLRFTVYDLGFRV